MKIIIFNQKGGVGKTMLATQIALYFDLKIVELDPYGILKSLIPERVIRVGLRDAIDKNLENVVFDFGGFDDLRRPFRIPCQLKNYIINLKPYPIFLQRRLQVEKVLGSSF